MNATSPLSTPSIQILQPASRNYALSLHSLLSSKLQQVIDFALESQSIQSLRCFALHLLLYPTSSLDLVSMLLCRRLNSRRLQSIQFLQPASRNHLPMKPTTLRARLAIELSLFRQAEQALHFANCVFHLPSAILSSLPTHCPPRCIQHPPIT
jgi:sensor domain CHASE-containing protein